MSKRVVEKVKSLKGVNKAQLYEIKEQSRRESYDYFDQNIRELPKNNSGEYIVTEKEFYNNDVDAFRHAYTSGVYTQMFFPLFADLLGIANEIFGDNKVEAQNMDLWNNSIGREYGEKTSTKDQLADELKKALARGELITAPNDPREYKVLRHFNYDPEKPVQVIQESESGRNEYFFDCSTGDILDRATFVAAIESGLYPGYNTATIDGIETPMSKPDKVTSNNLG